MPIVTGPLTTTATSDTFPTHDSLVGLGGLREVATVTDRNAISHDRRRTGMLVYTQDTDAYWKLRPAPWTGTNTDWQPLDAGSGGGGTPSTGPTVFQVTSISSWYQSHTYPYPPEVRLVEAAGDAVDIGVEYPDANTVYIEFSTPFSGTIVLS